MIFPLDPPFVPFKMVFWQLWLPHVARKFRTLTLFLLGYLECLSKDELVR